MARRNSPKNERKAIKPKAPGTRHRSTGRHAGKGRHGGAGDVGVQIFEAKK